MTATIHVGHVLDVLKRLPDESVQMCVTSPPYYGLRSYGIPPQVWGGDPNCTHEWGDTQRMTGGGGWQGKTTQRSMRKNVDHQTIQRDRGQFCQRCDAWCGNLGLEPTPAMFVAHIVEVFREVRRVLRSDGVLWINMGDSYNSRGSGSGRKMNTDEMPAYRRGDGFLRDPSLKNKDLMMIPARVAIALQDDGWTLRSDIIWVKKSPMPESAQDRPTVAHEHIFLLSKLPKYFYDAVAVATPHKTADRPGERRSYKPGSASSMNDGEHQAMSGSFAGLPINSTGANLRNVWSIASQPYKGAHFAVFPEKLVELCVKAGSSEKGRCGACGSPIRRQVSRVETGESQRKGAAWDTSAGAHGTYHRDGRAPAVEYESVTVRQTVGWEPTCEPTTRPKGGSWHSHENDLEVGQRNAKGMSNAKFYENVKPTVTLGWQSACACETAAPAPCVVLDPFAGSGTTGVVCERLGRDSILIELSADYALKQAAPRIRADAPLLNRVEVIQ